MGGSKKGLDVSLACDETKMTGRVGGTVVGMNVELELEGSFQTVMRVNGRVGGAIKGFDVHGEMRPNLVLMRLGGTLLGDNLRLELDQGARTISGRYGGAMDGQDVNLRLEGPQVTGQIGDTLVHMTITAPLAAAALAAGIAYKVLEDEGRAPQDEHTNE
jgi:hypothetical protein